MIDSRAKSKEGGDNAKKPLGLFQRLSLITDGLPLQGPSSSYGQGFSMCATYIITNTNSGSKSGFYFISEE